MTPCHSTDPFYEYTKWQSYLPALMACAAVTTGPVLEVGMGHYSTPLLHAYCLACGRKLLSLEQDENWFKRFEGLACDRHRLLLGNYDDMVPVIAESLDNPLSFIDNSHDQIHQSRARNFKWLLPASSYVVLHDYSDETLDLIQPLLKPSPVKFIVTDAYRPPTLVATDKPELQIPASLQALVC